MPDRLTPELRAEIDKALDLNRGQTGATANTRNAWIWLSALRGEVEASEALVEKVLDVAHFGSTDGDQHKMWVIDQMVRALTGDAYPTWVRTHNAGEDGPDTYGWEEGIAP